MNVEEIGIKRFGDKEFFLFKASMPDGRRRYIAKASFENGEIVVLDHWNLETLQKELQKISPVMLMARTSQ